MRRQLLVATTLLAGAATLAAQSPLNFKRVGSFGVDGVAEIVDATADGRTVIYTNSDKSELGLVDISRPSRPRALGTIPVMGEPTSVSVAGRFAVATVWTDKHVEGEPAPKFNPGKLYVIDLRDVRNPRVLGSIDVGWHPDSVKAYARRGRLFAVVAIENEPVILDANGKVTDNDIPGHPNDVSPAGFVQVVEINLSRLSRSTVTDVKFTERQLTRANLMFPKDPQPEFVDLHGTTAAVSLQENNGIAIIDCSRRGRPSLRRLFSLGAVKDRPADLTEDDDIKFDEVYPKDIDGVKHDIPKDGAGNPVAPGSRFPDSIAFSPDGRTIFSADEGELNFTGGRGFSVWNTNGSLRWDDNGLLERVGQIFSHYPEGRSENKGIEIEGITTARFGRRDIAIVMSERGSYMALFDITGGKEPYLMQLLPTGISPEGVVAIERRNLIVTAEEESGTLTIYGAVRGMYTPSPRSPMLYSFDDSWAAISGLAPVGIGSALWGIPDNAMPTKVYLVGAGSSYARVWPAIPVRQGTKQMRYDGEGIIVDRSVLAVRWNRGWWIASEGNGSSRPNLLVQVGFNGQVMREIQLPEALDAAADPTLPGKATGPAGGMKIRGNGFEGVTMSPDGRYLYAAIQRDFANEFPTGPRYARIARYDLRQLQQNSGSLCKGLRCGGDWDMFYYELDSNDPDNWAGLSEIISIGENQLLVIERDKGIGIGSKLKKIYAFSLAGVSPDADGKPDSSDTVKKVLALDVLDKFFPYEKIEGLALTPKGELWIGLDNDGGEVESRLINTGAFRNPLKR